MSYLKKFQKRHNLYPDGVLGKKTMSRMMEVFQLNKEEAAHFIGQISHETANFKYGEENLNYSESALLKVFGKYFTTDTTKFSHKKLASEYARKPEKIANWVYANRGGNGGEESGDGWKYRGHGALQLTLRNNYERFAQKVKDMRILNTPEIVVENYYFESGLYFFNENNLWKFCQEVNQNNIIKLSKAINLGNPNSTATPNGLEDRIQKTNKYYNLTLN